LRGIQNHLAELEALGVRPVAISVDSPEESRKLANQAGYGYTFLSDPNAEAIKRYDLLHAGAGENGRDISRPAEFLLDASGTIRWLNLTDDLRVRMRPEEALRQARKLT
jgi:peroxiredoxin